MRISEIANRFFHFQERGTHPYRECIAGLTVFLTMAYALVLIPSLLTSHGMHFDSVVTATVLTAIFSTLAMGLLANYPFIVAPGVAMVVYIHYVVIEKWHMPWQTVMGTIFWVGCLLIILTFFKVRKLIVASIPDSLRVAAIAGIGIFLIMIGLQNGEILLREGLFVKLNTSFGFSQVMVLVGLVLTGILLLLRFPAALFVGMVLIWVLAGFLGHAKVQQIVSLPHGIHATFLKFHLLEALEPRYLNALLSLLFVALFDATGGLMVLAHQLGVKKLALQRIFACDAAGSFIAGCLGTAPAAIYLESVSAIAAGGRTGLTAIVAAGCMVVALFFTPLIAVMPLYVTAPILILLGGSMLSLVRQLAWKDPTEWIPGCVTLVFIPLSLNIAAGIGVGYLSYCTLKVLLGRAREVRWFSWVISGFFIFKFLMLDRW